MITRIPAFIPGSRRRLAVLFTSQIGAECIVPDRLFTEPDMEKESIAEAKAIDVESLVTGFIGGKFFILGRGAQ